MLETERLYYTDPYLTHAESRVVAASDDGLRVTLDRTIFYPASGGQPCDFGTLNGIPVVDVVDAGETLTHVLSGRLTDTAVRGEIDWTRRYGHMQQHTGQHLLSAVFEQLFGIPTLSFRMGLEDSTIELGTKSVSLQQIEAVAFKATELARANPPIAIHFEDAAAAQGLRKPSERAGTLRIIEIAGVDRSACGGTHVASLAEVLPLQLRDFDKVRGNIRAAFVCGNRALVRHQLDFECVSRLAAALGTPCDKVESRVVELKQMLADSEKQRQRLEADAATRAGLDLYAQTSPGADGVRRLIIAEPIIDDNARTRAKAFTSKSKSVLLMHSAEGLLLAGSPDSGINASALLSQALSKYGARGGGSPTLAQGSLANKAILQDLMLAIGLTLIPAHPAESQ